MSIRQNNKRNVDVLIANSFVCVWPKATIVTWQFKMRLNKQEPKEEHFQVLKTNDEERKKGFVQFCLFLLRISCSHRFYSFILVLDFFPILLYPMHFVPLRTIAAFPTISLPNLLPNSSCRQTALRRLAPQTPRQPHLLSSQFDNESRLVSPLATSTVEFWQTVFWNKL